MRISLGSGATLATNVVDGAHMQLISGISLYPSSNYIGLTSVSGNVNVSGGSIFVNWNSGATVAISNLPTVTVASHDVTNAGTFAVQASQSGTWNTGITGLISLASGTLISLNSGDNNIGNVDLASAIPTGTNYIGLASIQGNVNINSGATVNILNNVNSLATINNFPATYPVTDNSGSLTVDWLSGATVSVASLPNVTIGSALPTGTNYIGLVSISGNLNLNSGSTVNVMNFPSSQAVTNTGTFAVQNTAATPAGTNNIGDVDVLTLPTIPTGANYIGLVTTVPGAVTPVSDNSGSLTVDWLSGATVSVAALPNVTVGAALPAGTNYIGLVSISGNLNLNSGSTVNVMNFPATQVVTQSGTWNVGLTGLVSLASGTFVSLNAGTNNIGDVDVLTLPAIPSGANFIGLASIQGNINATQAGTWNVGISAGNNHIGSVSTFGNVAITSGTTVNVMNFPATQPVSFSQLVSLASGTFVSLNAGTNHIGSVSIFGTVQSTPGMTTLFPGPNFIGLVTTVPGAVQPVNDNSGSLTVDWLSGATVAISNLPTVTVASHDVTNSGTFAVQAAQSGTWNTGITGLISLASGTFISLNAGTNAIGKLAANSGVDIGDVDVTSIAAGDNNIGNVDVVTLPAIPAGTNNIGDVDVLTLPALPTGTNFIGLATVVQGNQPALIASSAYIGLASVNIGGTLPALTTGTSYIGLVTITPTYLSTYTSLATILSAAGNATLFTPPSSQRWILKDLLITSLGRNEVEVKSGAAVIIPMTALATTGGYIGNFGDSGVRGKALNDAFVVNLNSAATVTVMANVRFEA